MHIGNENLFSVGCRVEATAIGSYNVFESKCKVSPDVEIGNHCVIGAGCTVVSEPSLVTFHAIDQIVDRLESGEAQIEAFKESGIEIRQLDDYTVIFGERSHASTWSGEGQGQAKVLHAKHIQYLIETLPKFHHTRTANNSKTK